MSQLDDNRGISRVAHRIIEGASENNPLVDLRHKDQGMSADWCGLERGQFRDVYWACRRWEERRGLGPVNELKAKQRAYYAEKQKQN